MASSSTKEEAPEEVAPKDVPPTTVMMHLVSQPWVQAVSVGGVTITEEPTPVESSLVPDVHTFVNELQATIPGLYVVEDPSPSN